MNDLLIFPELSQKVLSHPPNLAKSLTLQIRKSMNKNKMRLKNGSHSGLALYFLASNVIRVVMQYYATGWGGLVPARTPGQVIRDRKYRGRIAQAEQAPSEGAAISADIVETDSTQEEGLGNGGAGDKRQDRGTGYPTSIRQVGRQPRPSRRRHHKRR